MFWSDPILYGNQSGEFVFDCTWILGLFHCQDSRLLPPLSYNFYVRTHVKFTCVNKKEAMYAHHPNTVLYYLKAWNRLTWQLSDVQLERLHATLNLTQYIAFILFTRLRTSKVRDSGNPCISLKGDQSGCGWTKLIRPSVGSPKTISSRLRRKQCDRSGPS